MNKNSAKINLLQRLAKSISVVAVLFLGIYVIFDSPATPPAPLPDCSTIVGTAQPGLNCLFLQRHLCSTIPAITYSIPPSSLITSTGETVKHRDNCADLIDLPLCNQIDNQTNALSGKNCVKECSDTASFFNPNLAHVPAFVRGDDFARHNRDCIRFCDSPEAGITADPGVNCVSRKCHQLTPGTTPTSGTNCSILKCNLLTPDELNETKFSDSTKQYCDGDVKCYNFTPAQLPYLAVRTNNTLCKIHSCRPTSSTCGEDDTQNIISKDTTYPGYTGIYETYIYGGFSISTNVICTPVVCKPVIQRQYHCTQSDHTTINGDSTDTYLNDDCDATVTVGGVTTAQTCDQNFCSKKIDCNLTINNSQSECVPGEDTSTTVGSATDSMESWFYRPKPMDSATNGSGVLKSTILPELCYDTDGFDSNGWGWHPTINFGLFTVNFGLFHSGLDSTRSPKKCSTTDLGFRGNGYLYLCGTEGLAQHRPSEGTVYNKGYVRTTFSATGATHQLDVGVRYGNTMRPYDPISRTDSCGSRQCGVSCFAGACTQTCGFNVERTLTVSETLGKECDLDYDSDLANSMSDRGCSTIIDSNAVPSVRIRAVLYEDRICTFLDSRGQLAYPTIGGLAGIFRGTEKLDDGVTCVSGTANTDGTCNGYDTAKLPGLVSRWRTLMKNPYISNNQPSGTEAKYQGYLDRDGRLYKAQECIKVTKRIAPPELYNLATIDNSFKLFSPPLYIVNAMVRKDGPVSNPQANETLGKTDFHNPEINVRFGSISKKLSLSTGYTTGYATGSDMSTADTNGAATGLNKLSTTFFNLTFNAEVFVRKEYEASSGNPIFCLYRILKDANGVELSPLRVGCVTRNLPEINNAATRQIDPSIAPAKVVLYADSSNTYQSAKIVLRYLSSFGTNNVDDNCGIGDTCTAELKLLNSDPSSPTCETTSEAYKVCAQRDECTKLNVECIQNEVDIQNAVAAGNSTASFLAIRNSCNTVLLPNCNFKKGITDSSADILNQNPSGSAGNPLAYGWFNEICIVSGFESKLKNVLAYSVAGGVKGKCLVVPRNGANCDAGGKEPDCPCITADNTTVPGNGETIRKQTPHEAGLCIDIPLPQICPAIKYNTSPNPNTMDIDYVTFSLVSDPAITQAYGSNIGNYSNVNNDVHLSHKYRTEGKPSPNPIIVRGHAQFPVGLAGMNDIQGTCNGFWRFKTNTAGVTLPPKLSCISVNGVTQWDTTTFNECMRYDCPAVFAGEPDSSGTYQAGYGATETGDTKGISNGFAEWDKYSKTTDFLQFTDARSCITGFRKNGSTAVTSNGVITRYDGGTLPRRACNQIGQWLAPTNSCVRISCPDIHPRDPSGSSDTAAWIAWSNTGGAEFDSIVASRSSSNIQTESIQTGTCRNDLGFFKVSGGADPTRKCNHLGNWLPVENACVTRCEAITNSTIASTSNNGFSYWSEVLNIPIGGSADGSFNGCVSGYYPNPYPSTSDKYGNSFTISSSGPYREDSGSNSTLTTIPLDVSLDTRAATSPQRVCQSVTVSGGGQASVWSNPSSSCVNQCPGATEDSRIGVGVTQHPTTHGTVSLSWNSTNFGATDYIQSPADISDHSAANYTSGRSNGYYAMSRYCNPTTHKWDAPIVQCATNGGTIAEANATYGSSTSHYAAAGVTIAATGCSTGYYNNGTISSYACTAANSTANIDQYYFALVAGTPCQLFCSIPVGAFAPAAGHTYGGSAFSNNRAPPGTVISLTCSSGYGSAIIGGSRTNAAYNCGNSPSDRAPAAGYPILSTCGSNGTWSAVSNPCSACRTCTPTDVYVSDDTGSNCKDTWDYNGGSSLWTLAGASTSIWNSYLLSVSPPTVSSGNTVNVLFTLHVDGKGSGCSHHIYSHLAAGICRDGTIYQTGCSAGSNDDANNPPSPYGCGVNTPAFPTGGTSVSGNGAKANNKTTMRCDFDC